jgi:acyl-CoA oxidase
MNRQLGPNLGQTIGDERLRPFLPLIYTAWSDGELTADEIEGICAAVARFRGIDGDCQVALRHWLDPDSPPSPDELELLRLRVVAWAAGLDESRLTSVVDLGIAIAEATRADATVTDDERSALEDVVSRIGPLPTPPAAVGEAVRLARIETPSPTFSVTEMTEVLDGRHQRVRNRMRTLLAQPEFAYQEQLDRRGYRDLVLRWTRELADEGLGSLGYPAPYGEGDLGSFVATFAMLGYHDLSLLTKFGVQFGLFGGSIARLGTAPHHEQYLADAGSLALPGCFAMTETAHGSNVRDLETRAVYDRATDELVVTTPHDLARKDYIGNAAAHGRLAVVFARLVVDDTDHGVHAFLVPIRAGDGSVLPGVRIEDNAGKGGLNGVDNGRIWFEDVRIPRAAFLDRFASIDDSGTYSNEIPNPDRRFFTMIGTLVGGRVSVGAAAVNVAKSALTIAVRYAHRRRQFGLEPSAETLLIDYPLHQQRLIPRLAATYAHHFAFESLIDDFANDASDQRRLEARAAGLKAYATWHTIDTIQVAREACGAQGYLVVNRLTTMGADADIFTTYEGDNTVLTQLVAKALLSDFRQQFESMNIIGLVRYLAHRTTGALTEATPITRSPTDDNRLLDASWQIEQLRWREEHQVVSLARRIKKRIDAGADPFVAFTQVQTHGKAAARSHVEHDVLDTFASVVERLDDGPVRGTLGRLRALHGLATIRNDLGWYQGHGRLSAATAKAVDKLHDRLVGEVAAESLQLVDAFAIPEQVLAAPIATHSPTKK